jgi:predicted nucleic acid-binding protein
VARRDPSDIALSEQHAAKTGTRSLDILHIASARALRMKEFATFDSRQRVLAAAAGLTEAV